MVNLKRFFYPRTIAVIGASNNKEKVGGILFSKLLKSKAKIIPININEKEVQEKQSYNSVKKYPKTIDLAIIATPPKTVLKLVKECGQKRIPFIIIITSGFAETQKPSNIKLQKEIIKIAKKFQIRVLGPNCFGIVNNSIRLDTTFSNSTSPSGTTAFISQSGALWSYLSDLNKIKKGFSKYISLGNMSDLNFSDIITYLSKDKNTKRILLYIEKIKKGKEFIKACKKCKKPIYALKAGSSKAGESAAISHTASLASEYNIYQGILRQAGVKQVDSFTEMLEISKQSVKQKGKKTFIITNAGGAGAIISDMFKEKYKIVEKPLDILGTAKAKDYEKALKKNKNKKVDFFTIVLTPQTMSEPEETAQVLIKFKKKYKKKILAYFLGEKSVSKAKKTLKKNNIKVINHI